MEALYAPLGAEIVRTDVASAEMIKLASNAFLATKISFINEIANVSEELGADVREVARGMGLDDRIGPKFLQAGVGFGGSCFPKDVQALKQLAGNSGYHFQLLTAVVEVNELQKRRTIGKLQKHLGSLAGKEIALLGVAFKPDTDDIREATSLVLAGRLAGRGRERAGLRPGRRREGRGHARAARASPSRPSRRSTAPTPSCWSPSGPSSASSTGPARSGSACVCRWWWTAATSSTARSSWRPGSPTRGSGGRRMQALVLAGGEGTRLRPLTLTTPKPVMPLAGRPFLSFMLDWAHSHGVDEVILSCGFMSDAVRAVLGDIYDGMRLRYVIEDEPLGTAGPVRLAYDEGLLEERLLVLNGDVLTDIDLTAELEQHERTGARATLALYPVEDTSSYGVVPTASDGRVEAFIEKGSGEAPTNRINAGAYAIEREVVELIPAGRAVSFEREVFPGAGRERPVRLRRGRLLDRHRRPPSATSRRPGTCSPAACTRPCRRVTRPARSSMPTACWPGPTSVRRACSAAIAPSARMHASSALCCTSVCTWARTPRWSRPCSARACAWESARASGRGRSWWAQARSSQPDAVVASDARVEPGAVVSTASRGLMKLDKDSIDDVDPAGMLGDVLAQPLQLGDALWRAESAGIRPRDLPGGLVVCGMGGSAIGGDLATAALGDRATRTITTVRGYALEAWTPPETLVLCASYSGETEETLACFEAAGAAGAQRVVLTTGGTLARLARDEDVPVIGVPAGMQPRAAVIYMTIGALECAALCGAAPALHAEIDTATARLEQLIEEWGPGAPDDSLAKSVARELDGTIPVVHGAASTVAAGRRWSTQINENAKAPAYWSDLPEANHNQICGWERGSAQAPFSGVFLGDPDQHPRVKRRMELMAAEVEGTGARAIQLDARGESRLERVLSLVLLGDIVSVYLAVLAGVDPTPVDALERFKQQL